ncbi:MAG: sugar phosphate isomerase/epimerase [Planctomycetales bacterium]|nr:sugar phosphate isomerase/epimerase [Planctomycetales bacterium]
MNLRHPQLDRRTFHHLAASTAAALSLRNGPLLRAEEPTETDLKFMLGSCLYGYMYLGEILPEVRKAGAIAIDIWPKVHGNQREQLDDLGEQKFASMLAKNDVLLGCITQYALGPFGLKDEIPLAARLGCQTIVTGAVGPKGLSGAGLRTAVAEFCERMKPHLELAAAHGVTIAIENHANNLIESTDSLKWLADLAPSQHLAIALAPYHLPQDANSLASLIRHLGSRIQVFYAWQHGMGCMQRMPKEQELLQLPGRGDLDFGPLMAALRDIRYQGWLEIFMHPFPRGIPILESAAEITAEINRARKYLQSL